MSSNLNTDQTEMEDVKCIKHYSSSHKILLVGEGDFSFALSLARAFGSAHNMVATSLDSRGSLKMKYTVAISNLDELEVLGCSILHEVNAHSMNTHPILSLKKFDRIVFNFPHSGFPCKEHYSSTIRVHKNLVKEFLRNAREMLSLNGEIHITHKTAYPFREWKIVELAEELNLILKEERDFDIWNYPGYENKKGDGIYSNDTFPVGECSTFMFANS